MTAVGGTVAGAGIAGGIAIGIRYFPDCKSTFFTPKIVETTRG